MVTMNIELFIMICVLIATLMFITISYMVRDAKMWRNGRKKKKEKKKK